MLLVCICRSGARVHDVQRVHMDARCVTCDEMPKLTEILLNRGQASRMALARLLLLRMQRTHSNLRFDPTCHLEKAGDVVEATGGILSPRRVSAGVVVRYLGDLFGLTLGDVQETVEAMGALVRQCQIFYAHICRSELNEDDGVRRAFATIRDCVAPVILPCRGSVCPVCESLAALPLLSTPSDRTSKKARYAHVGE